MNATRLAMTANEVFPALERETEQGTGYRRTGGFWLARTEERLVELRRIAAVGEMAGLDARMVGRDEVAAAAPNLRVDDLAGALWVAEDGQANPVDVCMAYAKGARTAGVRIREGVACTGIERRDRAVHAVRLSDGTHVRCETVVNCAGAWARAVGAMAGVPVPLQAVEHMYVTTEPLDDLPDPFPIVRDLDGGIYLKEDAGKLVLGGFEPKAKPWNPRGPDGDREFLELPEDWEQFEPFMRAGLERVPALERAGIRHFMNGPESFTPDTQPLLGESPFLDSFFVAAGFNSTGMMSSAGAGRVMAQWIAAGEAPMDLWDMDIARFDRAANAGPFLATRVTEAVGEVFAMHWPYRQAGAGRGTRRSALHDAFAAAGAVFGAPAGWERPLWFACGTSESRIRYSYGAQAWWPAAEREATAVRDGVALLELTPFTKVDVRGPDALALLQRLCTRDIDIAPDRAVYTLMLNPRGGIEADVTVTRIDEGAFRIVSGAATRVKDLAWIERQRRRAGLGAEAFDATSSEVVLGIAGPRSRELLGALTPADLSNEAWPFAASRRIELAAASIRMTRLELHRRARLRALHPGGERSRGVRSDRRRRSGARSCALRAPRARRLSAREGLPALGPRRRPARHTARSRPRVRRRVGQAGRLHRPRRAPRPAPERHPAPAAAVRGRRHAPAPAARRARLPPRDARGAHHIGRPGVPHRPFPLLRVRELRAGRTAERSARRRLRDRHRRRAFPAPRAGAIGVRSARRPAAKLSGRAGMAPVKIPRFIFTVHPEKALPRDRGRPARLNTCGPSACCGRDARDPGKTVPMCQAG